MKNIVPGQPEAAQVTVRSEQRDIAEFDPVPSDSLWQPEAAPERLSLVMNHDEGFWMVMRGELMISRHSSATDAFAVHPSLASAPAPASAQDLVKDPVCTVSLAECPVGLFTYRGTLCLKSEYGDNSGRIDAYIVSSGEFFWGGTQTASQQRKLLVTPAPDLLASLRIAVGHVEHMAAFITTMNQKHNAGYSFESLGEDMPDIRSLLSAISGGAND